MGKQINRSGYDERSTKIMMERPITELSRLIGEKWFLSIDLLAEKCGVNKRWISQALNGGEIGRHIEQKIRDYLEKL